MIWRIFGFKDMGQGQSKLGPLLGESCKDYIGRISDSGYYLVNPWVDNLAGWTEAVGSGNPFPRDGANDLFHLDMIKGLCLDDEEAFPWYSGDPDWDKDYMEKGGIQWLKLAPKWHKTNKHSGWNWSNVRTVSKLDTAGSATYKLNTTGEQKVMWDELMVEMNWVFKLKSSLPIALNCKQKV